MATSLAYEINTANGADLEPLTFRKSVWVLNRYVALLLEDNLVPFNVWTPLYREMCVEGFLPLCTPLIDYLRFQLLVNMPLNRSKGKYVRRKSSAISQITKIPSYVGIGIIHVEINAKIGSNHGFIKSQPHAPTTAPFLLCLLSNKN